MKHNPFFFSQISDCTIFARGMYNIKVSACRNLCDGKECLTIKFYINPKNSKQCVEERVVGVVDVLVEAAD